MRNLQIKEITTTKDLLEIKDTFKAQFLLPEEMVLDINKITPYYIKQSNLLDSKSVSLCKTFNATSITYTDISKIETVFFLSGLRFNDDVDVDVAAKYLRHYLPLKFLTEIYNNGILDNRTQLQNLKEILQCAINLTIENIDPCFNDFSSIIKRIDDIVTEYPAINHKEKLEHCIETYGVPLVELSLICKIITLSINLDLDHKPYIKLLKLFESILDDNNWLPFGHNEVVVFKLINTSF